MFKPDFKKWIVDKDISEQELLQLLEDAYNLGQKDSIDLRNFYGDM